MGLNRWIRGYHGSAIPRGASAAEIIPLARTISAGTGLTGGGDLSANRTLAVDFTAVPRLLVPATHTTVAHAITINWTLGNLHVVDVEGADADVELTLSNPVAGATYYVKAIQGSVARDLVWPAAVLWPAGTPPVISVANNAVDMITLVYDGSNYLATFSQAFA